MSGIVFNGMSELSLQIENVLKEFPEKRKLLHETSGKLILKRVINNTPYDEAREEKTHLRDAIYLKIGSKGGYAAVRVDNKKAPHAHLVENGHIQKDKTGTPTGKFVKGKHMFAISAVEVRAEILNLAEQFSNEIAGGLK